MANGIERIVERPDAPAPPPNANERQVEVGADMQMSLLHPLDA